MKVPLLVGAVLAQVLLPTGATRPAVAESPEIALPATLEQLDPAVRRLVQGLVERVRAEPTSAGRWLELGLAYEANLLWPEAQRTLAVADRMEPGSPWTGLHLALATREAGDFGGALTLLRALGDDHPGLAPVQQRLGLFLLEIGDFEAALEAFDRLLASEPRSAAGLIGRGEALLGSARFEEAVRDLRRALELAPGDPGSHHRLGLALRGLGDTEGAERELARGRGSAMRYLDDPLSARVRDFEVHLTARVNRAAGLLGVGRAAEAETLLAGCLADHPENLTVLNNLAIAQMRQGRLEEARASLDRALSLNAEKFSTYINLSAWAQRSGDRSLALEMARAAVARGPDSGRTHATLAGALASLGRFRESAVSIETAIELEPAHWQHRLFAASLAERADDPATARAHLQAADALTPDLLPVQLGLARTALALGLADQARQAMERASALAPGHPALEQIRERLEAVAVER